jgi:hypothetical protein
MERDREAADLRSRAAAAAANTSISSDDPDAPEKLRARITNLEATHALVVATNKIVHAKPKDQQTPEKTAALQALNPAWTEARIAQLFAPDFCGRIGFPAYELSNRTANIRRLRERLTQMEALATQRARVAEALDGEPVETVYAFVTIRENVDLNRLQMLFAGKPSDDVRSKLKASGFRWSPIEGAWQRQLNGGARFAAEMVVRYLSEKEQTA